MPAIRRAPWSRVLVLLLSLAGPVPCLADAAAAPGGIHLNQLGFLPAARKLAVVERGSGGRFEVLRLADGAVVHAGELSAASRWAPAARMATLADFSALSTPGRYRLRTTDGQWSDPFDIGPEAYAALADAALKAFYFGRSGTALAPAHAGPYARPAGHPDTEVEIHRSAASAQRPAGSVISAPFGWYDAGDYNKYVVNSGITTWTLLAAWEDFPGFFHGRELGIPESGDAVPDILDEAWWNLRWMLAMQDPHDGGVYHKLTNPRFDGLVMPEAARERRYVVQKSTAATLDFAAVMAMASRVYAPFEAQFPGQSAAMRAAALQAWAWAEAHPDAVYRQPADVLTGAYGDQALADEFAWAAAELYLLTGEASYLEAFERHAGAADVPSWARVGSLGWASLARHRDRLPQAWRDRAVAAIEALATQLAQRSQRSAWGVAMEEADFVWGSTAQALNQALVLVQAYRLSAQRATLDAAQSQLDLVLGRNPLGVSFVTGYGLRTPMRIHHRPSQADGIDAPVPGWLSGGPNPRQQDLDDCKGVPYPSALPALSWIDHACSYASNEVAINWNAPLVYVAAAIQSLTPVAPAP